VDWQGGKWNVDGLQLTPINEDSECTIALMVTKI
jgi:hypothetical protein